MLLESQENLILIILEFNEHIGRKYMFE